MKREESRQIQKFRVRFQAYALFKKFLTFEGIKYSPKLNVKLQHILFDVVIKQRVQSSKIFICQQRFP